MKQIKFFAMAFAALAMFSCAKDKMGDGENPPVVEGVETYATFNFQVEGSNPTGPIGKAGSETDLDKTAKENDVNNIRIVIFKEGGTLEVDKAVTLTTSGADKVTESIKLTSGAKKIFVFANATSTIGFPTLTAGTTLEDCYKSLIHLTTDGAAGDAKVFSVADITGDTKGYFMSNIRSNNASKLLAPGITAAASATGGEESNHFKFTIQRAVSKVRAKLNNADVLKIVGTGTLADPMATLTATQYTVRNLNKALTPIQLFATDGILEPSETDITSPQAAHFNLFDKWTPGATETATVKDLSKKDNFYPYYDRASDIDQTLATTDQANYVFASENTNNKQVVGNTTYLAIKAIYNPKNWVTACTYDATGDGGFTITTEAATAATTFHAVNFTGLKQIGGTTNFQLTNNIFKDEVIAKRILTEVLAANKLYPDGGASIGTTDPTQISENKAKYDAEFAARFSTYTGGACYYRLNIGRSDGVKTVYGIRRNGKYEITINSFKQLGVATEGKLDDTPEVPVSSQDTYVTATISVAPWKTYTQGGDL